MAVTLVAFFALGFFAATVLTLFRFLTVASAAAAMVCVVAFAQGMPVLGDLGLGCGGFAVAQIGFGLGLAWTAATRSRFIPD